MPQHFHLVRTIILSGKHHSACAVAWASALRVLSASALPPRENRVGQNHTFIGIYGVRTVFLAGKSPYIRSYTVQTYGSVQPYVRTITLSGKHHSACAVAWASARSAARWWMVLAITGLVVCALGPPSEAWLCQISNSQINAVHTLFLGCDVVFLGGYCGMFR